MKTKSRFFLQLVPFSAILCLVFLTTKTVNAITITEKGTSEYTIVLGNKASLSEEHGAKELQKFLGEIGGAFIPISRENEEISGPMILVGQSDALESVARVAI